MKSFSFVNEIGNKIKISIKKVKSKGKNKGREKEFNGVEYEIEGPTSSTTNLITMKEAKVLDGKST